MRAPTQPSEEEKQDNFARRHEPYSDWCEECVAGRDRGVQRRKNKDDKEGGDPLRLSVLVGGQHREERRQAKAGDIIDGR